MIKLNEKMILRIVKLSNTILVNEENKNNLSMPFSCFYNKKLEISFENYINSSLSYLNNEENLNEVSKEKKEEKKKIKFNISDCSKNNKDIEKKINAYERNINILTKNNLEHPLKNNNNNNNIIINKKEFNSKNVKINVGDKYTNKTKFNDENTKKIKTLKEEKEMLSTIIKNKIFKSEKKNNKNKDNDEEIDKFNEDLINLNLGRNFTPEIKKREERKKKETNKRIDGIPQIKHTLDFTAILKKNNELRMKQNQ